MLGDFLREHQLTLTKFSHCGGELTHACCESRKRWRLHAPRRLGSLRRILFHLLRLGARTVFRMRVLLREIVAVGRNVLLAAMRNVFARASILADVGALLASRGLRRLDVVATWIVLEERNALCGLLASFRRTLH